MSTDLPDYQRKIVVVDSVTLDITGSVDVPDGVEADIVKVKGVTLVDPTVAAALPISIENDAIAYDGTNDRFKIDVEKWSATDTVTADVIDKATRLLGVIYGSQGQKLLQMASTYELLVQLRHGGAEIDPRAIRALTSADVVDVVDKAARLLGIVYGSQGQKLQQKATSYELLTYDSYVATLLGAGLPAALDTGALKIREQNPLTTLAATQATYANLKAQINLQQLLGSDISLTNYLPTGIAYPAGTLIDPRAIRALTAADIVTIAGTVAADNIVMDALRVSAYTERRSTLSNNGVVPTMENISGNVRRGKFFPRGARGYIETVDIYCDDSAAAGGTITIDLRVYPSGGIIKSANVTVPPAGAGAWRSATFQTIWNYDSLFISHYASNAAVRGSWDNGTPYDCYGSDNAWTNIIFYDVRPWLRVIMKGETCGDVPVSGTVSLSDRSSYEYAHCTADTAVKASAGRIHTVTINKCTTAGALTIYDNTAESGTVIAIIALTLNMLPQTLTYDVLAKTGIYVGFDGTLAADITVSYI